jgi:hypothetical protein
MRLPWEQLAMEVIEVSAPELGAKLYPDLEPELGEAAAGWGVVHLVKWALARCPEHMPPSASALVPGPTAARQIARAARYRGDPETFIEAAAHLPNPVVEVVPEGIRLRGLDRYDAAWADRHKEEWKAYKLVTAAFPPEIRRKSAGASPDLRRPAPDPDPDAEKEPPPPARPPLKLVVVGKKKPLTVEQLTPGQRRWWELMQRGRANAGQLAETAVPPDFPAWADRCDVRELELAQVDHALALYLRDGQIRAPGWPTAVFITPGVFEQRLPERPAEAL